MPKVAYPKRQIDSNHRQKRLDLRLISSTAMPCVGEWVLTNTSVGRWHPHWHKYTWLHVHSRSAQGKKCAGIVLILHIYNPREWNNLLIRACTEDMILSQTDCIIIYTSNLKEPHTYLVQSYCAYTLSGQTDNYFTCMSISLKIVVQELLSSLLPRLLKKKGARWQQTLNGSTMVKTWATH